MNFILFLSLKFNMTYDMTAYDTCLLLIQAFVDHLAAENQWKTVRI